MSFLMCQAIINTKMEYIAVNQNFRNLHDFKDNYEVEGKRLHEFPHPISEMAEKLEASDQLVMREKKIISGLTINEFNGNLKFIYNQSTPIYENGIVVGCDLRLKEISIYSVRDIILKNTPRHIVFQPTSTLFTEKEHQVLFLLFANFSKSEITKILNITLSSINYRLQSCYNKTSTVNLGQLIEYYHNNGYYTYMPEIFRQRGHTIFY